MKNITNILLAALMLLGFASCNSQLDIEKHGNMGSIEDFYKTDAQVEQAAAAMYLNWRTLTYNEYFVKNLLSDDAYCGGGNRGDNGEMERLNEYTFGSDNSMVTNMYSGYYTLIYYANLIIDHVTADTDIKIRDIAEAKVARGYAHLMLGIYFGTAPVVDHLLTGETCRLPNGTREALYEQAIKDFGEAIASGKLTEKATLSDTQANNRITLHAAYAFLGKAHLFAGNNAAAAEALDKVILSHKYGLVPSSEYEYLLHADHNNCCENIMELQKRNDAEQQWNQFDMLHLMCGWRTSNIQYSGLAAAEMAQGTYGFLNPTKALYDAFVEMGDTQRRMATLRTYDEVKLYGVETIPGKSLYGHEGYYFWKNRTLKSDVVTDQSFFQGMQFINNRVMRYAEVLLMAAEANLGSEKANTYLNEVRQRAGLPNTSATLDAIKKEKRLELCIEGTRFEDLVRWGDAATVLAKQGARIPSCGDGKVEYMAQPAAEYGFTAKHNLLPIPMKEREINPNMNQNQGW